MRVVQSRCLKCGSVFAAAKKRISYCTTCFADETYLKMMEVERGAEGDRPGAMVGTPGEARAGTALEAEA